MDLRKVRQEKKYIIPEYLREKYQLIGTVTFAAFFSLLFLLVSLPFNQNAWFHLGASQAFAFTVTFFILCLMLIIVSKRLMYATRKLFKMTYLEYAIWNLSEVFLIGVLYTVFSIQGETFGIIKLLNPSVSQLFMRAIVYGFISLIIPYIIAGMFFAIVDKNKTIRLMNVNDIVTDEPPVKKPDEQKITLFDNSGVMKLSVSLSNLYYIESDDNYIIVWYSDSKGDMKKYMLRCRLKTVEESFMGSSLVRCHRKYIVNMQKVKVLRKEKDGYELDLDNDTIPPISITKTYAENVLSKFDSMSIKV